MSKHDLIMLLGNKSKTKYHELIIECMDFNNKTSTRELTIEELTKFCKLKGFLQEDKMITYNINGVEVIDNTPEAEVRLSAMEYIEERRKRERKRKQRKNPLWKLVCFCGIL